MYKSHKIMKKIKLGLSVCLIFTLFIFSCAQEKAEDNNHSSIEMKDNMKQKVTKAEKDWKEKLTPEEYHILREKGTERAFTGKYYDHKENGTYCCAGCGNLLFSSEAKYESGTGWPSFDRPFASDKVDTKMDKSYGMKRTEVLCNRCGGHLGHVFEDGPPSTGLRYCINSASLDFIKKEE